MNNYIFYGKLISELRRLKTRVEDNDEYLNLLRYLFKLINTFQCVMYALYCDYVVI